MEHWKAQDASLLNTPVVTNAPQTIPSVELDEDQDVSWTFLLTSTMTLIQAMIRLFILK